MYWSINVLIGAVLLACLLLWVRPHWRDLERLKRTAERFGKGHLDERTQLPASSNIGSLAHVFDTMAGDIEKLLNQQRDLLNAVSHELRTPLTRLDFGLALALSDDLPAASRERLQGLVAHIRELDELVLELLSYSRLQNPACLPEQIEVALDEFIDSILGSVDDELESDVVIDVLLYGTLERFTLDPRLTARALQNLLRNATRYCEKRIQVGVLVGSMVAKSGSTMMASAFPTMSGSGSSSLSIAWIVAVIVPRAVSAWAWPSVAAPWRLRVAR